MFFHDLKSGAQWGVQQDERFPAASVIKVPIMLELLRQARAECLSLEEPFILESKHRVGGAGVLQELSDGVVLSLLDLCRLMIVVSDNIASNALLDRVGLSRVNALMEKLGMRDSHLGRRFMEPATPDRDNHMSARDAARCIEVSAQDPLALEILQHQQYREKIPLMLPESLKVAHKTGELDGVRHDAGLIGDGYVLALFTRAGGAAWEVDLALARLSKAVYDNF